MCLIEARLQGKEWLNIPDLPPYTQISTYSVIQTHPLSLLCPLDWLHLGECFAFKQND